jgi:hypothetical protein
MRWRFGRLAEPALVEQVAAIFQRRISPAAHFEALPRGYRPGRFSAVRAESCGQIQQAAARLEAVEAKLATDEAKRTPEVQAQIAAIRAWLARETGNFATTIALSREALAYLPEQDTLLRAIVTLNLAVAHYFQGNEPAPNC